MMANTPRPFGIEDVYSGISTAPIHNLMNCIEERDDAIDADCILQSSILQ